MLRISCLTLLFMAIACNGTSIYAADQPALAVTRITIELRSNDAIVYENISDPDGLVGMLTIRQCDSWLEGFALVARKMIEVTQRRELNALKVSIKDTSSETAIVDLFGPERR